LLQKFRALKTHQGFQKYLKNTSWMMAEQLLRLVSGIFVGAWVARYLGPESFGVFSYALAFSAIFITLAKLGLDTIAVKSIIEKPLDYPTILSTTFWLKIFSGTICLLIATSLAVLLGNDFKTVLYISIISAGIIFNSLEVIDFYFQSQILSKYTSISRILQLLFSTSLRIYFVYNQYDLIWFVSVVLLDQITIALALIWMYKKKGLKPFWKKFCKRTAQYFLKFSYPLILSAIMVMIYLKTDQIMLKKMLGDHAVGIYSAGSRLVEVLFFIPGLISTSLFPSLVNAYNQSEELFKKRLSLLLFSMFLLSFLVALTLSILSPWIIQVLYGNDFAETVSVLKLQAWSLVFSFMGIISSKWFIIKHLQKMTLYRTSFGAIINVVLNFILIPRFGVLGATYATLFSQFFASFFINFFHSKTRPLFYIQCNSLLPYKYLR
jgi:O-antigen/teichoic acid export membrane protein